MNARASSIDVSGVRDALATLGLSEGADAAALKAAFRTAVKAARPDQVQGDAERFRRVIAAYRLIQAHQPARPALAAPQDRPPPAPVLVVTPLQAVTGAPVELRLGSGLGGRTVRIAAPAGLRTGDHLRLRGGARDGGDLYLPVLIRAQDGLSVLGDDLFMTWPVERRTMADGGRVEIETHAGPRSAWITPDRAAPVRVRLKGLGLPARGSRPAGHLFVSLTPTQDTPSAAGDLLLRFTRAWTPERLAA
ncbi:DnaJ C-terminal domain-containing protein [Brevundimonas sp. SORGH_AS_0993]|uniref:DnaJ C-terminal domain-containing protein n=1 Tax=Brevundimonas sp. SORGH_AS_0993 TaxID=3041794 RepID=UPI00277F511B|nr:DnaJ C-terminal domain-containing protein [Brevundimonas sp. SORGH_AS_0993]MDQ1152979.1 curved DNA-binding protein [Brevundimonas sp. SORGH_AS_0993]